MCSNNKNQFESSSLQKKKLVFFFNLHKPRSCGLLCHFPHIIVVISTWDGSNTQYTVQAKHISCFQILYQKSCSSIQHVLTTGTPVLCKKVYNIDCQHFIVRGVSSFDHNSIYCIKWYQKIYFLMSKEISLKNKIDTQVPSLNQAEWSFHSSTTKIIYLSVLCFIMSINFLMYMLFSAGERRNEWYQN